MRRLLVSSMILMLGALGWTTAGLGEEPPAPRGELRIVDKHHANWISIVLNVFEHLVELDKDGRLVPRLATRWQWLDERTLEMALRPGVTFHDGTVFDAESVKLNWEENTKLKQPLSQGTFMNFKPGSRLEVVDPQTIRFVFPEPDGAALAKLSLLHIANRQFYRDVGWGEKSW